jgi:hypothetical protein
MAGLVPAIHVAEWMPATSAGMTAEGKELASGRMKA